MSTELKIKYLSLASEAQIIRLERRRLKAQNVKIRIAKDKLLSVDQTKLNVLETQKQSNMQTMNRIQIHKIIVVRTEARSTHLARNFLKGTPYQKVETVLRKNTGMPDFKSIETMVKKYGQGDSRVLMQKFSEWIDTAEDYINRRI